MAVTAIISYDGTPNDDDALALGKRLAAAGVGLSLAYVRHSREFGPGREELAQHDAEQRLERGAATARGSLHRSSRRRRRIHGRTAGSWPRRSWLRR